MKNKKLFFILFLIIFFIFILSSDCFAADPKLVSKIKTAFDKINDWMIKISTPAAAVAVGTGVFMKKFSFR
jgi:hypothetical protein